MAGDPGGARLMQEAAGRLALCTLDALRAAGPLRIVASGTVFAVFLLDGTPYVTQDDCTHGPGSLAEGFVTGEEVECPFHQGRFHIPTGRPTLAPCTVALRVWPARVIGGSVCIDPAGASG